MRRQNKKLKKITFSWPWVTGAVVLIALLAGAAWYTLIRDDTPAVSPTSKLQDKNINYSPPTKDEKKEAARQKEEIIQQEETPSTDQSLNVTIVTTFQDPGGINIRTIVGGTKDGECHIAFTKSGQTSVTKTVPIVFEATSANCQNTPIPLSDFPAGGTWDLKITAHKGGKQSPPASISVDVVK
jgi:hypothetical protein